MTPAEYRALSYVVFPCAGKRPARARTWPTDTLFQVGDNIGLVVPVGVVVIDLDIKPDANGVEAFAGLKPNGWRHTGPRALTGGGGLHLWFRVSPLLELGNSRGALPAGIDVRGGGKGYVIAPPSVHPVTGALYEWQTALVAPEALPELPDWVLEHILAAPAPPPSLASSFTPTVEVQHSAYVAAALASACEVVRNAGKGERNNTLNGQAYSVAGLDVAGLDLGLAEEHLYSAATQAGLTPKEARATIRSALRAGAGHPRVLPSTRSQALRPASSAALPPGHPPEPPPEEPASRTILIGPDELRVNDEAIVALGAADYPDLYQRSGELVRVIRAADRPVLPGADKLKIADELPIIRPLTNGTLRERLSDCAIWHKLNKDLERKPAHPPIWSVIAVADRGEYPGIATLRGIASYPMIRADGTVATSSGYDEQTGYYLGGLPEGIKLAEHPTQADAEAAAGRLLELVSEFDFRGDIDRAAWLAYLLTPLARAVIRGPTPLFLIEANVRGTGKTLLADLAGLLLTGLALPAQTYPYKDDELEKILVSVARYGLPCLCFDNVVGALGGPVLDKWLTSTRPTGRVLGSNDMPQFDWQTLLVATANNASVHGDTDRRAIYVTLETAEERPELRSGWKIPDLPVHIVQHRAELLGDALTILRAHHEAGLPPQGGRAKGTFEGWASRVRDAVMYAGLPDCERAADDPARPTDADTDELAALLEALDRCFGDSWFSVGEALENAFPSSRDAPWQDAQQLREVLTSIAIRGDRPTAQQLGKRFKRYRNRWLNGRVLNNTIDSHRKANAWRVLTRPSAESAGSQRRVPTPPEPEKGSENAPSPECPDSPQTTRTTRNETWRF